MAVTDQDKLTPQIAGESDSGGPKRLSVDDDGKINITPNQMGEVQETPSQYTLLRRLKDLLTGTILAAGTNVIGKIRLVTSNGDEITNDDSDAVKVDNELQDKVSHPFGKGALTTDGIQYSAEHTTTTDDYEAVETITFYNLPGHTMEEIEFGLTMAIKSSGGTESVLWKWQGSDNGTDWEDLIAEQTRAADASTYQDVTASGRFAPTGNFLGTGTTFQIRAVIKSGGAGGETATGKAKNSSYIRAKYRRT